ncbi:threonine/serine exporter family protein [Nocardia sp. NPDC051052]|uniref:threonine/serine exporter family protein n=1 Tax=Nocardia sp. NPDC051052 TaxID=3364322 RepID=UPI00378CE34D
MKDQRLDKIRRRPARVPRWVTDLAGLLVGVGLCLYLQPVLASIIVAGIGSLIVMALTIAARRSGPLRALLPVTSSFLVAVMVLLAIKASLLDGALRTVLSFGGC